MTTSTKPVVRVENCRKRLGASGAAEVVFNLDDFELASGQIAALTGPSGCGKSTFLNMIAGLLEPDQGTVKIDGLALSDMGQGERDTFRGKHVGYIQQTFNLLDPFSAIENIELGMRFGRSVKRAERSKRAAELLERVGLSHRAHAKPASLSVGERQRVAIARAIANDPVLLLADEPTGSLDPKTAEDVFALLLDVCREKHCAMLFVTHDHDLVERLPRQVDCRELVRTTAVGSAA